LLQRRNGFREEGEKEASTEVSLSASIKSIPLFGLGVSFSFPLRFPGGSASITLIAGLVFNTDLAFDAAIGNRTNACETKDNLHVRKRGWRHTARTSVHLYEYQLRQL